MLGWDVFKQPLAQVVVKTCSFSYLTLSPDRLDTITMTMTIEIPIIQGVPQHWTLENLAKSQALYKYELDT